MGDTFYKWGSNCTPNVDRIISVADRNPEKRFIVMSSLENLEKEIDCTNVYIVPIGGCITKQGDKYPSIVPVIEKNTQSTKSFISLNHTARSARLVSVNYIYGNDLDEMGYITTLDERFKIHYLDTVSWKFEPRHVEYLDYHPYQKTCTNRTWIMVTLTMHKTLKI
jgi:hypothetical protein